MRGDGKNKFYRTLNLDKDAKGALNFYRQVKDAINKESKKKKK